MSLETIMKREIIECICDNCYNFHEEDKATTFDERGYTSYAKCWVHGKYVRLDWSCVNWKRKKKV